MDLGDLQIDLIQCQDAGTQCLGELADVQAVASQCGADLFACGADLFACNALIESPEDVAA